jgi:hypothetical protein
MAKTKKQPVTLSLMERLIIASVLPEQTNYQGIILKDDIFKKTKINQEEQTLYGMKFMDDGSVLCNKQGSEAKFNYEFTDLESDLIGKGLKQLDQQNKLIPAMRNIYELFAK